MFFFKIGIMIVLVNMCESDDKNVGIVVVLLEGMDV